MLLKPTIVQQCLPVERMIDWLSCKVIQHAWHTTCLNGFQYPSLGKNYGIAAFAKRVFFATRSVSLGRIPNEDKPVSCGAKVLTLTAVVAPVLGLVAARCELLGHSGIGADWLSMECQAAIACCSSKSLSRLSLFVCPLASPPAKIQCITLLAGL